MTRSRPKHSRCQDYVISDGRLVGEFEQMYQDHEDPWDQSTREEWASEKAVALNLIRELGARSVIEIGCGLGHYTKKIADLGVDVLGIDISEMAIRKARSRYPRVRFAVGDITDFDNYREHRPDVVVMAEVTRYVLEKLDAFLQFFKAELRDAYLIHLLTTYRRVFSGTGPPSSRISRRSCPTSDSTIWSGARSPIPRWGAARGRSSWDGAAPRREVSRVMRECS